MATPIRVLLLVLIAGLFVGLVVRILVSDTGAVEKVVLAAIAVMLACAVPRVQRLGRTRPH